MTEQSPFHAGEEAVQKRLGVYDEIGPWARKVVRPSLPEQHQAFYAELPFLVAAARDGDGRPWATLLAGEPGFARAADATHLALTAWPAAGDALDGSLAEGSEVGFLGIDLATRRRNRVNGRVARADGRAGGEKDGTERPGRAAGQDGPGWVLAVDQAFGNCPQYIREREWERVELPAEPSSAIRTRSVDASLRTWITGADTFFIATGHCGDGEAAVFGMDASHRGGDPGFVQVANDTQLVFPDYAGNNHFNTLGNLVADPRAGLLFVDFETGSMLQLTGRATIDWDSPAVAEHPGARRLVVFDLDEAVVLREALPLRFRTTGESVRTLRVAQKTRESEDVTSFVFEARDGGPLAEFEAGQHLPIQIEVARAQIEVAGAPAPLRRTYSLSSGPGDVAYRISVKREPRGLVSRLLHDAVNVGDFVNARTPAGDFVLGHHDRPVALVSAGVGVTPMLSMLRDLHARGDERSIAFVHVARDGRHHPLAGEIRTLVASLSNASLHVLYSRPGPGDEAGRDFEAAGRLDSERLAALLPGAETEVYLCGPVAFMAQLQEGLEAQGVRSGRIHSESFGPLG